MLLLAGLGLALAVPAQATYMPEEGTYVSALLSYGLSLMKYGALVAIAAGLAGLIFWPRRSSGGN